MVKLIADATEWDQQVWQKLLVNDMLDLLFTYDFLPATAGKNIALDDDNDFHVRSARECLVQDTEMPHAYGSRHRLRLTRLPKPLCEGPLDFLLTYAFLLGGHLVQNAGPARKRGLQGSNASWPAPFEHLCVLLWLRMNHLHARALHGFLFVRNGERVKGVIPAEPRH